jgi:hypothetical protein
LNVTSIFCAIASLLFLTPSFADQLSATISTGHEKITSPLVRIDIDSPLILVEGRTKLAGQYQQLSLNGVKSWEINPAAGVDVSGNVYVKQAPNAPDLNFSTMSLDASLRNNFAHVNVGIGPSVQRIWVANQRFRDSISLQSDFTFVTPQGGFTNIYVALSNSLFVDAFQYLDSKAITVSFTHHIPDVGLGFSALDLQFNASREKNTQDEDRDMLGLTWSLGASITKSYFDAPFFDGFETRQDRYVGYEFGVERKITDHLHANLDFYQAKNTSNLALFESQYHSVNLSLNFHY